MVLRVLPTLTLRAVTDPIPMILLSLAVCIRLTTTWPVLVVLCV